MMRQQNKQREAALKAWKTMRQEKVVLNDLRELLLTATPAFKQKLKAKVNDLFSCLD